jgi:hypothetical protein
MRALPSVVCRRDFETILALAIDRTLSLILRIHNVMYD